MMAKVNVVRELRPHNGEASRDTLLPSVLDRAFKGEL